MIMQNSPKENGDGSEQTGTLSDDQQNRGYYYDDAHGYEKFDPDEDDDIFKDEHEAAEAETQAEEESDEDDEGADLSGGAFDVDLD